MTVPSSWKEIGPFHLPVPWVLCGVAEF